MADEPARRVYLFGTGGTISFVGETRTDFSNYSYRGQQLTIQEMLARVPEAGELAEVIPEQVINVGSTEVYPPHWLTLARRINERFAADPDAAGAAVTHDTATLEETAYFLNLTVRDTRPVAVTGAMPPPVGTLKQICGMGRPASSVRLTYWPAVSATLPASARRCHAVRG